MGNHRKGNVKPSSTRPASHRSSNSKQVHDLAARDYPYGIVASPSGAGFSGQHETKIGHDDRSDHRQTYFAATDSLSWRRTSEEGHSDDSMDSYQGSGMPLQNHAAASDVQDRRAHRQYQASRAQAMMEYVPQFQQGPVEREPRKVIERTQHLHRAVVSAAAPQPSTNGGIWDDFAQLEAEERARKMKKYPNGY